MASFLDRLLGRPEPAPTAKAVTGPGAYAMTYHTPWHSLSKQPNRLMAEGQSLFHSHGWVAAAERTLGGRFVRMPWHLEDANGKTVDDKAPEELQAIQRLLERPTDRTYRSGLWSITFRHLGLSGNAFWYLDQTDALNGAPLSIIYINPARMTPATDEAGNVAGWVLDHPDNPAVNERSPEYRQGVPLRVEEVIHFTFDEPDWGIWGVGIPEAAQRKIELDRLTDTHAAGVLASGGRLSGIVAPKEGASLNIDEWQQFVRDWRAITSDPDAAKRLQISKAPIDFIQTTAAPKDLQLIDVSRQGRDDILAQWGVPLTMLGISVASGLNSDRADSDDAAIWETIKARGERIHEKVQFELLDRFGGVSIVFDYPEFDDEAPLYAAAAQSVHVALTNDERRNILGLEPLEDKELGAAIYIASSLTRIDVEPEPAPMMVPPIGGPPNGGPTDPNATPEEVEVVGKADLDSFSRLRERTEGKWEPRLREIVAKVLGEQAAYIASRAEHIARKPSDTSAWWNEAKENKRLERALLPALEDMAREVSARVRSTLPSGKARSDALAPVLDFVRERAAERVVGINQTTRDAIAGLVEVGVNEGLSPADLSSRIRDATSFNEARTETISRTETMLAYNTTALQTYGSLGVTEVEAIDGDTHDEECAARNGQRFLASEALEIEDHPNGTLDWIPVIPVAEDGEAEEEEPPTELSADEAQDRLLDLDDIQSPTMGELDGETRAEVVSAFEKMVGQYPTAFADMKGSFGVDDLGDAVIANNGVGTYNGAPGGFYNLQVNSRLWKDRDGLVKQLVDDEAGGWAAKGATTPESAIVHEIGHMIDARSNYAGSRLVESFPGVSGYGKTDLGERFAEAVRAVHYTPVADWTDEVRAVAKFLEDWK